MSNIDYLFQMIQAYANQTPDKIALVCNKEKVTYLQLYERSIRMAKNFAKHLSTNSTVALHLPNSLQLVYAYLGCFAAGIIAVPMSIKLKTAEIEYILKQTKPAYLISHQDQLTEVQDINFHNLNLSTLFIVNDVEKINKDFTFSKKEGVMQESNNKFPGSSELEELPEPGVEELNPTWIDSLTPSNVTAPSSEALTPTKNSLSPLLASNLFRPELPRTEKAKTDFNLEI